MPSNPRSLPADVAGARLAALTLFALCLPLLPAQAQGDNPSAETLRAAYAYTPPRSLPVTIITAPGDDSLIRQHLVFTDTKGESVPGLLVLPRGSGPFPCALLLHGLGSNKEEMIRAFGERMAQKGIACLALDAVSHGERKQKGEVTDENLPRGRKFANLMQTTILDYRQALDYLQTRKEIDPKRIGLLGYSLGSMMGAILAGVDTRIAAAAFCVGGDAIRPGASLLPKPLRTLAESVSPSNYIGLISPRPVYLVNAKDDQIMPAAAAKRFQEAAKEPKTLIWVNGGHILSLDAAHATALWLGTQLLGTKGAEKASLAQRP